MGKQLRYWRAISDGNMSLMKVLEISTTGWVDAEFRFFYVRNGNVEEGPMVRASYTAAHIQNKIREYDAEEPFWFLLRQYDAR